MRVYPIQKMKNSLYWSESIHINVLQEKPELEKLHLYLDGAHEGGCKKPGETFTAVQRNISLLFRKQAYDGESIEHTTT